jgi:hypothetical protein
MTTPFFVDLSLAIDLGIQYINKVWHCDVSHQHLWIERRGSVWIVGLTELEVDRPFVVALSVEDGGLRSGSPFGKAALFRSMQDELESAKTSNGLDVASLFFFDKWKLIVASAMPTRKTNSIPFLTLTEELGDIATANADGTITVRGKTLRPAKKYRQFLSIVEKMSLTKLEPTSKRLK